MSEALEIERRGNTCVLTINRPERKNAITPELLRKLCDALDEAAADAEVRVIALTGGGGSFCSGADLTGAGAGEEMDIEAIIRSPLHGLIRRLRMDVEKPTVALVDGPAAGYGADLAMACDIRLCSTRAYFSELFGRRGLIPDGGGTYHLPRLVGLGKALELVYTGEKVFAEEAVRIGLANRVFADAEFEAESAAYLERLSRGAPRAMALAKRCMVQALSTDLEAALANEARHQLQCLKSQDFIEGLQAFFERREPQFKGE